ncbi:unnamed protein product [Triticum turgidum subsp. durum]|uniref:Uncharacterized protein n=1 Tax=Triticum turgidum subsp. durum TaxID=4567 RepID=A0A9R0SZ91_TRITD|nr:unnamed protein product [Triticum turgidum subsp. durum]
MWGWFIRILPTRGRGPGSPTPPVPKICACRIIMALARDDGRSRRFSPVEATLIGLHTGGWLELPRGRGGGSSYLLSQWGP